LTSGHSDAQINSGR